MNRIPKPDEAVHTLIEQLFESAHDIDKDEIITAITVLCMEYDLDPGRLVHGLNITFTYDTTKNHQLVENIVNALFVHKLAS